jgi:hypothetical protein
VHIAGGLWIARERHARNRHARNRHVRNRRIRLRDAVPVWRDRRELRRRFRHVTRAVKRERRVETTAALQRLSADRVLLSGLVPGTPDMDAIVEFVDGTRLLVGLFTAKAEVERLGLRASRCPVWLAHVQPCFGHRRFWLWLASADQLAPLEVLASVQPFVSAHPPAPPPAQPEERGGRR